MLLHMTMLAGSCATRALGLAPTRPALVGMSLFTQRKARREQSCRAPITYQPAQHVPARPEHVRSKRNCARAPLCATGRRRRTAAKCGRSRVSSRQVAEGAAATPWARAGRPVRQLPPAARHPATINAAGHVERQHAQQYWCVPEANTRLRVSRTSVSWSAPARVSWPGTATVVLQPGCASFGCDRPRMSTAS